MSMTELQWADLLLEDIPAPVTANTEADVLAWMRNENYPGTWWGGFGSPSAGPEPAGTQGGDGNLVHINPLNASVGSGSGGGISPGGTGSYPDLGAAAEYTAQMINQQNMAPIKSALEANDSQAAFGAAAISTPWAGSHYGGDVTRFEGATNQGPPITNPATIGNVTPGAPVPLGPAQTTSISGDINEGLNCLFGECNLSTGKGTGPGSAIQGTETLTNPRTWEGIGVYLLLIGAGAGLVMLGAFKVANPGASVTSKLSETAKTTAETAGAAATVAAA